MARSTSDKTQPTASNNKILERLDELEKSVKLLQSKPKKSKLGPFFKQATIYVLVFLCAVMVNLTAVSLWLKRTIVDSEVWTQKTSAVLQDESIQADISTKLTNELLTATNAKQLVAESLPPRLSGLTVPLTSNLERFTQEKISSLLSSEQFQTFWTNANKSAHSGIIASLENGGKAPTNTDSYVVYINNNKLLLNLKPIVQNLQTRLTDAGLGFVGNVNLSAITQTVTLTEIQSLPAVLAALNVINRAAPLFGILAVLFGAGALTLSRSKRKTIIAICVTIIVLMVLNVQALYLAQYPFIQQVSDSMQAASTATGTAVYTIYTSDLIALNRFIMILSLIILVVALLTGPGRPAVAFRRLLSKLTTPKQSSSIITAMGRSKTLIISSVAILSAILIIFPPVKGQTFPLIVVTIASLLCLWVYSLDSKPEAVDSEKQ